MKENKTTFSASRSGLRCGNKTSHLPLNGHMLRCVRNRAERTEGCWGGRGSNWLKRPEADASLLTFCFSLAAFTQGAVVGGGGARQNNVSFHLSLPTSPPHLHTKCAVPSTRFHTLTLSHTLSDTLTAAAQKAGAIIKS